ncbi:type II toxin-antitoxin system Phd/YefM family antitoxin, partial [Nonomuraea maritima]|uniref:type II toxin-antitoxin system Phd/YefM family antitoxin n=1 Tax=Nonomuraea maritima TaxID=683260 RepID=UPI001C40A862
RRVEAEVVPKLHGNKCTIRSMDVRMGIRETRERLGDRVNAAHYLGEATIVERNGTPYAVLVPYEWWTSQQDHPDTSE